MTKFTLLFSTLPIALGGLCGCRSAANPLQAERTPTTTPVVRRLAGDTTLGHEVASFDLGSKYWDYVRPSASSAGRWITTTNVFDAPSNIYVAGHFFADYYETCPWSQITNLNYDNDIAVLKSGNLTYIGIHDNSTANMTAEEFRAYVSGKYIYFSPNENYTGDTIYEAGLEEGYTTGYDQGRSQGYTEGYDAGVAQATGELVLNETYTGLYAFYNQYYLSHWAYDIEAGYITSLDHFFIKFSAENYEFDLYFYEMDGEGETFSGAYEIFAFVEADETTMSNMTKVGQLSAYAIADDDYSSSWLYQFNPTTFSFTTIKQSANEVAPINFGRQMTLHHYANLNGAKNFIIGKGNQYAEGYNAGHQDTIEATEAFNNVFTIFGKAFAAVSSFLNLNIGPFKMWYFFLMPIIVALFILVLRLVKH